MTFTNEAKRIDLSAEKYEWRKGPGAYEFDKAPRLLFSWSGLFQRVISQAGTYLLTGKFHDRECAIYKCEGGCNIPGVDELVLCDHSCYFDFSHRGKEDQLRKLASLISEIVLAWNPEDPTDSMLAAAAKQIGVEVPVLEDAIAKSHNGGVFGGNALSSFFRWNPFDEAPIDRTYERFCLVKFCGKTDAEVDQKYADQDLGKSLRERINAAILERHGRDFYTTAMCCSPNRNGKELKFWVNTGRQTQIDGWKTQAELERFIRSGEKIRDRANY